MSADKTSEALRLLEEHGARTPQFVVDQIVAAIRCRDDEAAVERGAVLRAVEAEMRDADRSRIGVDGSRG